MGIFSKIKDAIFGKKAEAAPKSTPTSPSGAGFGGGSAGSMQEVDVEAVLTDRAARHSQELNWQSSIVDLMKLLELDSSYGDRKELAVELGREDYSGTAEDNIWLHRAVMNELAKNGGRVPASLRD